MYRYICYYNNNKRTTTRQATGRKGYKMESTYFGNLKTKLIMGCGRVNDCADDNDTNRNRVNYGQVTAFASVVREMGHSVDIPVWEDNGFLRIPELRIDGQTVLEYFNGK